MNGRDAAVAALGKYSAGGDFRELITRVGDARERALCEKIVLGVLQNAYFLDWHIARCAKKSKLQPIVRNILRAAAYQIIFLS
ncbi:MAG: hypothetical protein LBC78_05375, partial [Oscillospiraceae bacterium]|nr:hypothetical protein [Oscillospiraceae bacterium]